MKTTFYALKRIIQYMYGTLDHGLQLYVSPSWGWLLIHILIRVVVAP